MSFNIQNHANVPVNVRISNAGITYFFKNNLAPYETYHVPYSAVVTAGHVAAVWYDITAYYSSPDTEINPGHDNVAVIGGIATTVVGVLAVIVGVVLIPTGVGPAGVVGGVTTIVGGMATLGGTALLVADHVLYPVTLSNMYGPHEYWINVTGNMNFVLNKPTNTFTLHDASPIGMKWANLNRGTGGTVTGRIDLPHDPPVRRSVQRDGLVSVTLPYTGPRQTFPDRDNTRLRPGRYKIFFQLVNVEDDLQQFEYVLVQQQNNSIIGLTPNSGVGLVFELSWRRGIEGSIQLNFGPQNEFSLAKQASSGLFVGSTTAVTVFSALPQPEGGYCLYFGEELQYVVWFDPRLGLKGTTADQTPTQLFFREELSEPERPRLSEPERPR